MTDIYVLHFNKPYWLNARHYVGYTKFTAAERIATHRSGNGSLLVKYALSKGLDFELAFAETYDTIPEARAREIALKKTHAIPRLCPICKKLKSK